jgi:hypothetical protein
VSEAVHATGQAAGRHFSRALLPTPSEPIQLALFGEIEDADAVSMVRSVSSSGYY